MTHLRCSLSGHEGEATATVCRSHGEGVAVASPPSPRVIGCPMCDYSFFIAPRTPERDGDMLTGSVSVLVVGLGDAEVAALAREDGFAVRSMPFIETPTGVDAVV